MSNRTMHHVKLDIFSSTREKLARMGNVADRLPKDLHDLCTYVHGRIPVLIPVDDDELQIRLAVQSDSNNGLEEDLQHLGTARAFREEVEDLFAHLSQIFCLPLMAEAKIRMLESIVRGFAYGCNAAINRWEGTAKWSVRTHDGIMNRARSRFLKARNAQRISDPHQLMREVFGSTDPAEIFQATASEVECNQILAQGYRMQEAHDLMLWWAVMFDHAWKLYSEALAESEVQPKAQMSDKTRSMAALALASLQMMDREFSGTVASKEADEHEDALGEVDDAGADMHAGLDAIDA